MAILDRVYREARSQIAANHARSQLLDTAGHFLEMNRHELRQEMNSGKTLIEIAQMKGKSVEELKGSLEANADKRIRDQVDRVVNSRRTPQAEDSTKPHKDRQALSRVEVFEVVSEYLGVSKKDLAEKLRDGKNISEIAKDSGKNLDELKTKIVNVLPKGEDAALTSDYHRQQAEEAVALVDSFSKTSSQAGRGLLVDSYA